MHRPSQNLLPSQLAAEKIRSRLDEFAISFPASSLPLYRDTKQKAPKFHSALLGMDEGKPILATVQDVMPGLDNEERLRWLYYLAILDETEALSWMLQQLPKWKDIAKEKSSENVNYFYMIPLMGLAAFIGNPDTIEIIGRAGGSPKDLIANQETPSASGEEAEEAIMFARGEAALKALWAVKPDPSLRFGTRRETWVHRAVHCHALDFMKAICTQHPELIHEFDDGGKNAFQTLILNKTLPKQMRLDMGELLMETGASLTQKSHAPGDHNYMSPAYLLSSCLDLFQRWLDRQPNPLPAFAHSEHTLMGTVNCPSGHPAYLLTGHHNERIPNGEEEGFHHAYQEIIKRLPPESKHARYNQNPIIFCAAKDQNAKGVIGLFQAGFPLTTPNTFTQPLAFVLLTPFLYTKPEHADSIETPFENLLHWMPTAGIKVDEKDKEGATFLFNQMRKVASSVAKHDIQNKNIRSLLKFWIQHRLSWDLPEKFYDPNAEAKKKTKHWLHYWNPEIFSFHLLEECLGAGMPAPTPAQRRDLDPGIDQAVALIMERRKETKQLKKIATQVTVQQPRVEGPPSPAHRRHT